MRERVKVWALTVVFFSSNVFEFGDDFFWSSFKGVKLIRFNGGGHLKEKRKKERKRKKEGRKMKEPE